MEIIQDQYQVIYDQETGTITCSGTLRLQGSEYKPIIKLLGDVVSAKPPTIILDVRELLFLNSSGINTLSKFVIQVRRQGTSQMVVKGSNRHPWQKKSLTNLQRLKRDLQLEIE